LWFATPEAAAKIAQMLGGKAVESNDFTSVCSPVQQQQPNQVVEMPDGRRFNAGWIASFYNHGFSQSYIDQTIQEIVGPATTP
jgi:hypothetical protein